MVPRNSILCAISTPTGDEDTTTKYETQAFTPAARFP